MVGRSPPPMRPNGRGSGVRDAADQCSPPSVDLNSVTLPPPPPRPPRPPRPAAPAAPAGAWPATIAYTSFGLLGEIARFAWIIAGNPPLNCFHVLPPSVDL